jgi:RNA polymerase sigma factor (sigma-70 family)
MITKLSNPGAESQVKDLQLLFKMAYSYALRAAKVRSAAAAKLAPAGLPDREDMEQDALLAVFRAMRQYDPSRASLRTFVERVVTTIFASMMRVRRRQPKLVQVEDGQLAGLDRKIRSVEFGADFERITAQLAEPDRRLAALLLDNSPTEVSKALGISRSRVYRAIKRIRTAFGRAGFAPRGRRL